MPFYPASDRDVQPGPASGPVACRCCPGGTSRSRRACRYPADMSDAERAVCEPLLPCGCRILCHFMRPGHTRGSGRRAGPAAEPGYLNLRRTDPGARRLLVQGPVRPVTVIVIDVFAQDQPQVPLAGD
jgi:hypothetical protein